MPDPVIDPAIVDLDRVAAWMDDRALGDGPITDVELIAGGTQNVLLRFRRGEREFVLRRPPPHKRANSDETMRREARVLGALAGTDVPHPGLIAAEPDLDVIGAAFYLMEPVDGFNATLGLPEPHASDVADAARDGPVDGRRASAPSARVDLAAAGLTDLGKPDGWGERQVPRWRKQLDGYSELPGYPGPSIPRLDDVAAWLDEHRPDDIRMGLIHGDFHFANVLISPHRGPGGGDRRLGADHDRRPAARPRPPARRRGRGPAREAITPVAQATGIPSVDERDRPLRRPGRPRPVAT